MEQITILSLIEEIANDFCLNPKKESKLRLPASKIALRRFTRGVAHEVRIFDGISEHPYMIDINTRNNTLFERAVELRYLGWKSLEEILKEAGIELKTQKCKICEGGGWYFHGTRYFYKSFYSEN